MLIIDFWRNHVYRGCYGYVSDFRVFDIFYWLKANKSADIYVTIVYWTTINVASQHITSTAFVFVQRPGALICFVVKTIKTYELVLYWTKSLQKYDNKSRKNFKKGIWGSNQTKKILEETKWVNIYK